MAAGNFTDQSRLRRIGQINQWYSCGVGQINVVITHKSGRRIALHMTGTTAVVSGNIVPQCQFKQLNIGCLRRRAVVISIVVLYRRRWVLLYFRAAATGQDQAANQ